jgi:hypothetical protein
MQSVADRQLIAYRAGLDRLPFHWCQLAPRHRTAHQCQRGAEFITEEEKGDAWEDRGGILPPLAYQAATGGFEPFTPAVVIVSSPSVKA